MDSATFNRLRVEVSRFEKVANTVAAATQRDKIQYRKCPSCDAPMNRSNFGKTSGVIVDSCSRHGIWLDAGEPKLLANFLQGHRAPPHKAKGRKEEQCSQRRSDL